MKRKIVVFSSRKRGNCEHIADHIKEYSVECGDIFRFSENSIAPCGDCTYEYFSGVRCPHWADGEGKLLDEICRSDEVVFVLPNYCDYPCANFFIFNERSNSFFQRHPERLDEYLQVPKKFIVVSNSQSDHFREAFLQHSEKPEILFLSHQVCGTKTVGTELIESQLAKKLLQEFLNLNLLQE